MSSCLGQNFTKATTRDLLLASAKLIAAIFITAGLVRLLGAQRFPHIQPPSIAITIAIGLIISPIWFGFYALFKKRPLHWGANLALASGTTAMVAVYLLPDLQLWFLHTIFKLAGALPL